MRLCPHRLALAEEWIRQSEWARREEWGVPSVIALLHSVLCFRADCRPHTCMAQIDALSEGEYLDYVLEEVRTGRRQPYSKLTAADLEAIEEEHIGEEFARYPFLY